jgi:Tol biopolymer transport system component
VKPAANPALMNRATLVAAALLACSTLAPAAARTITEADIQSAVSLSSPAVSPDGTHAVLIVTRQSWKDDRRIPEIVDVDLKSGSQRVLTYDRKGLSDPAFSPDGTQLAFIANNGSGEDATSQIFVMPLSGGDARPITSAKDGVDQFAWRPDGKAIVYAAAESKPERKGPDRFRDSFVICSSSAHRAAVQSSSRSARRASRPARRSRRFRGRLTAGRSHSRSRRTEF